MTNFQLPPLSHFGPPVASRSATVAQPKHYPALAWNIDFEIERRLPQLGEVLVTQGQRVDSDTVVARTLVPGRPRLFNLTEFFEVEPREVSRLLLKKVNEPANQGDVIAQRKGFLSKQFKAPFDAILSAFDAATGYLSLTPTPKPFNLDAYVRGTITATIPNSGVKIELKAGYAKGAFGFGDEQHGVLKVLTNDPSEPMDPAQIEARASYFILLGGSHVRAETLRRAVEMKVRGIICGSIREEELTKFLEYRQRDSFYKVGSHGWRFPADLSGQDSPLTLVITEGFGQRPMASPLFELLLSHDGQGLSINGSTKLRHGQQHSEIIVPVSTPGEAGHAGSSLNLIDQVPRPGSIVRLTNHSYLGSVGFVRILPPPRRGVIPGQVEHLAEVEVNGSRLILPFADLEVLQQTSR
ncbi:MAG: hypothetical protein WCS37_14375 [Chloroflexota bacterium]